MTHPVSPGKLAHIDQAEASSRDAYFDLVHAYHKISQDSGQFDASLFLITLLTADTIQAVAGVALTGIQMAARSLDDAELPRWM